MRPRIFFLLFFAFGWITTSQALADKRVALVIGNSAYKHVPKLPNPERDAEAVGGMLRQAGFDSVEVEENLSIADMRRVVRDFSEQSRDAAIAVIYFAGHGLEAGGANYLIPVDATLRRDIDVEDESVSLDRLLQVMEQTKSLRLVILDACRDNPFANSMTRTMVSRAIGRGLARVEPPTSNTLVAFAAKAGSTAADGDGLHSPFTTSLLKNLATPGLDVRLAFGRIRDEVLSITKNRQEPFVYGSLGGATITLSSLTLDEHPTTPSVGDPDAAASRDYDAAVRVGTKEVWDAFLQKYPTGLYADFARAQRKKLVVVPPPRPEREGHPLTPNSSVGGRRSSSNVSCCLEYYRRNAVGGAAGNACSPETKDGNWNLGLRNWCKLVADCKGSSGPGRGGC